MSIKIYKGFKINNTNFSEIMQMVTDFRPWVEEKAEEVMENFLEIAKQSRKNPQDNNSDVDVYMLWLDLREKVLREKQRRLPAVDTDFSISFIPSNDYVLGIVYTEHQKWFDEWCNQPSVQEYCYWDNADRPNEISETEWCEREKAWGVLSENPVSMQSFCIDVVDPGGPNPFALKKRKLKIKD